MSETYNGHCESFDILKLFHTKKGPALGGIHKFTAWVRNLAQVKYTIISYSCFASIKICITHNTSYKCM